MRNMILSFATNKRANIKKTPLVLYGNLHKRRFVDSYKYNNIASALAV